MIKKRYGWIGFWIVALCITFFSVASGNFFTKKVSLQIGEIAKETIYAPFQVENEIATQRKKDMAEKEIATIYKTDSKVQEKAIGDIEHLFEYTIDIQTSDVAEQLEKAPVEVLGSRSPIALYNEQYAVLLNTSLENLEYMKEVCIQITSELFEKGIESKDTNRSLEIRTLLEETNLSVSKQKIVQDIIANVITPNVVVDEAATNDAKKLARDKVDAVYILTGEKIIEKGTRVTEETYTLLDKVGYLDTDKSSKYKQYVGLIIIIVLLCLLSFKYVQASSLKKKWASKQLSFLFILYILAIVITRAMLNIPFVYIPLGIVPMLVAFAMGTQIAVIMNIILVITTATIFKGDIVFTSYFMITGVASILSVAYMQERTKTMMNALLVGCIQLVTYLGLKLFIGTAINIGLITESIIAFVVGMVIVIAVVGALPVLESAFGFVTPMQLLELTNPNQPVLKRLLLEATGTYYHSLLVANLAESAAAAIGANPLMARVGGYYHDIGKLTHSNYFKENQGPENPHDYMSPFESYEAIVSHVTGGIALAEEYNLPQYIKDMIVQHHGTSIMQYFFVKAQEEQGADIKEEQFQYPGPKPRTKEAALIMLADVVEATTRSMQDQLSEDFTIEHIVTKMVKQKLKEGQLDECELYISDIDKIIESFNKMLKGMYHERIKYPERNDKKR